MGANRVVSFKSGKDFCEGDLFLPDGFDASQSYPALVLGHGLTVARTSLLREGAMFAAAGYVALTIDYRNFGGSGGSDRHSVDPRMQSEDFRSAIDWLEQQPGVDRERIGIWGTSFGGGIATLTAAYDERVKVCVAQAPILDGDVWLRQLNREADYLTIKKYLTDFRRKHAAAGTNREDVRMPVGGSTEDGFTPMPPDELMLQEVMEWYGATGEYLMNMSPDITVESYERVRTFDAVRAATKIAPRAYCIVQLTGRDIYHPGVSMNEAYKEAGEPKSMVCLQMNSLDCYKPDGRAKTIQAAVEFFDRHLKS